jgi:RNA polymerase sigma factor (sigma-70 family)
MSAYSIALTDAVVACGDDLYAYLQRRIGPGDAADLLSETMVVAWRRVAELPAEPEPARMWLFGIARGTLANHARSTRRRHSLFRRARRELPQAAASSDEGLEVRDAIARLSPDLAELIRLVHWDGLSLVAAAEMLEISASTARGRYARAKRQLRAALQEPPAPQADRAEARTPMSFPVQ